MENIIRDLLRQEGLVTTERPSWARSQNTAALYLQAGQWMLFILEPDRRTAGRYTCVTVVNGPEDNDWENALRRGYIHTPPPLRLPSLPSAHVGFWMSVRQANTMRRAGEREHSLLAQVLTVHRSRRNEARQQRAKAVSEIKRAHAEHERLRARAWERRAARRQK